jgi:hypothetical protein
MNTKISLTTLIAAATLAAGGVAMAQPGPDMGEYVPSSTAGAGCTATANAMRAGNLGGSPSRTACPNWGSPSAEMAAGTTTNGTSGMGNSGAMANSAPTRVAPADRN